MCYYCKKRKHQKHIKAKTMEIEEELLATKAELLAYARHLTKNEERARDLMQETVLKILVGRDKFEKGTSFRNWARKVMYNTFLNNIVREEKVFAVDNYSSVHHDIMYMPGRNEIPGGAHDIYKVVNHLPDGCDRMIKLLITGHKYSEIAMILDIPIGTVKSRIFASRAILREELKDYLE